MNTIKSNIKPPALKKKVMLPEPPKKITNNLEKKPASSTGLLQFHVPIEIKREFKIMAASQDISQVDLFTKIFDKYKNILS